MERLESIHYKHFLQGNIDQEKCAALVGWKAWLKKTWAGFIVLIKAWICLRAFTAAQMDDWRSKFGPFKGYTSFIF